MIIPASFLAETGLQDEIEMSLYNHSIVIAPVKENPRQGWFDGYHAADDEDGWDGFVALPGEAV